MKPEGLVCTGVHIKMHAVDWWSVMQHHCRQALYVERASGACVAASQQRRCGPDGQAGPCWLAAKLASWLGTCPASGAGALIGLGQALSVCGLAHLLRCSAAGSVVQQCTCCASVLHASPYTGMPSRFCCTQSS
jgi:hypothetical protein